jgi:hypothetical protein
MNKIEMVYLIEYKVKSGETSKAIGFGKTIDEVYRLFMSDWLEFYNRAVIDGESSLVSSPDEIEHITIEPLCSARDVVGR